MSVTTCVFDAYGTLFDVAAAAREAAAEPEHAALAEIWPKLAQIWRQKQLQYTWIRAVTGAHCDFDRVTEDGLDFTLDALAAEGFAPGPGLRDRLIDLYRRLSAYGEVADVLSALKHGGFRTAILSNGSPRMLAAAVEHAGLSERLDAVLSVEEVGVFKPDRRVYDLVGARFGTSPAEVLFVSSNGWDAAAATGYGFTAFWANRGAEPVDRLPWRPAHIAADLTTVPAVAEALR